LARASLSRARYRKTVEQGHAQSGLDDPFPFKRQVLAGPAVTGITGQYRVMFGACLVHRVLGGFAAGVGGQAA